MQQMIEEKNDVVKPPKIGELIQGKVAGFGRSALFVDLGPRGTGIIYGREFFDAKESLKALKKGDQIFAKVVDLDNEEGYIELSLKQAGQEMAWEKLRQMKIARETVTVKILGANKGGLMADVEGIKGFLPVSQLSFEHYPRVEGADSTKILKELQKFVGEQIDVEVYDVNATEQKLILSEKATETKKLQEVLNKYKIGDVIEGEITGIVDFGAFMKFSLSPALAKDKAEATPEFIEGLIHISELDWQLVENPAEIVKVGEKIKAKIIDVSNGRISLSLKALKKDPWDGIEKKYKKGDTVKGEVTKFNPYGAFVKISDKIQGLCHISEFGIRKKMEETLQIGEKYDFRIQLIDPKNHKMALELIKPETPEIPPTLDKKA